MRGLSFHKPETTTILVADDDKLSRHMIRMMVEHIGYQVVEATTGEEALSAYETHQPHMVLLDAMMPIKNGFIVAQTLNDTYGEACAPIIMITALGDKQSIAKALNAGAFDYVTKPFNPHIIRNRISRLIDLHFAHHMMDQRNHFLESLWQISHAVNSTLDRQKMLEILTKALVYQLEATSAYVSDLNIQDNATTILATFACKDTQVDKFETDYYVGRRYSLVDDYPDAVSLLLNSRDGYIIRHVAEDQISEKELAHLVPYGVKTILHLPLSYQGELLGYIVVWNTTQQYDFSQEQLRLAVAIANVAAQSFYNATLYEKIQETATELEIRNHELDAYNHTVAHDLKNPISVVTNFASLAAIHAREDEKMQRYLDRIQSSGYRMAQMVDQLLLFSKLSDATALLQPVDMLEAALMARSRFEHELHDYKIMLTIMDDMPMARGHALWLEEVFANLIGNAIKYRDHTKDKTHIQIRSVMVGTDAVRYEVQDNGIGIKNEERDQLFQMFSRLDSTPADVKGFGLGLSIIKRIIDKLNGKVGMDSIHGEGSTFWFELPLAN